jgi:hypothetical protein
MISDPGHAGWLRQARSHLSDADPVLARLIDDRPDFDPRAWIAQLPPMDQSIRIEMYGDLHEYGALGRVVTKAEALQAI